MDTIVVTGGAGFIGSNFVRHALAHTDARVVVSTSSPTPATSRTCRGRDAARDTRFVRATSPTARRCGAAARRPARGRGQLRGREPRRPSIDDPGDVRADERDGRLRAPRGGAADLREHPSEAFRFLHVSTDEVYGSLGATGAFTEATPYAPNSPYAASKAAADHLVRAYHHTYGLPMLLTNCSNNYGPGSSPRS